MSLYSVVFDADSLLRIILSNLAGFARLLAMKFVF